MLLLLLLWVLRVGVVRGQETTNPAAAVTGIRRNTGMQRCGGGLRGLRFTRGVRWFGQVKNSTAPAARRNRFLFLRPKIIPVSVVV
uniref:Putative secreted peptide n=1 Tax=Anopheles braziliensis TaxID=58242 RepID=A0A2M3ZQD4_9DIPT